jgi:predicted RNA binding protein YcfA (HicA-like mRNA interferase family)
LKPITGPEMCRLLEVHGWRLERVKGSHHIYSKSGERRIITIPVHENRSLKPGLASRIGRMPTLDGSRQNAFSWSTGRCANPACWSHVDLRAACDANIYIS